MRKWISLLLSFSLIVLLVTGVVLYVEPPGRIAFWTDWKLLGLDKHQWDALHTVFGFLFLILSIWHLLLNWRPLMRYMRQTFPVGVGLLLSALIFWGTITYKPPFRWIIDWQRVLKDSWQAPAPVIPHAEQMPLGRVARLIGLEPQEALAVLRQHGIRVESPKEKLEQIARKNHKSPSELFELLQKFQKNRP